LDSNSQNEQHNEKQGSGRWIKRNLLGNCRRTGERGHDNQRRIQQCDGQNGAEQSTHGKGNPRDDFAFRMERRWRQSG